MAEYNDDPEEYMDDEDWEDEPSFEKEVYNSISPAVKQFLINYFGEILNDASPQTFLNIEAQIKEDIFQHAGFLCHYFRMHCTITDKKEWEVAFQNFKPGKIEVAWPVITTWYDQPIDDNNDEDSSDWIAEDELTPEQEKAKQIIDSVDEFLNHRELVADFVKKACKIIVGEVQEFLQKNAAFDLSVLLPEGFIKVQQCITFMAEDLAENLYAITEELRNSN